MQNKVRGSWRNQVIFHPPGCDPFPKPSYPSAHYHPSQQKNNIPIDPLNAVLTPEKRVKFAKKDNSCYSPLNYSHCDEIIDAERVLDAEKNHSSPESLPSSFLRDLGCSTRQNSSLSDSATSNEPESFPSSLITEKTISSSINDKSSFPSSQILDPPKMSSAERTKSPNIARLVERFRYGKPLPRNIRNRESILTTKPPVVQQTEIQPRQNESPTSNKTESSFEQSVNEPVENSIIELQKRVDEALKISEIKFDPPNFLHSSKEHSNSGSSTSPRDSTSHLYQTEHSRYTTDVTSDSVATSSSMKAPVGINGNCTSLTSGGQSHVPTQPSVTDEHSLAPTLQSIPQPTLQPHQQPSGENAFSLSNFPSSPSKHESEPKLKPEDDILHQWRLRRKMEEARKHRPTWQQYIFPTDGATEQTVSSSKETRPTYPQTNAQVPSLSRYFHGPSLQPPYTQGETPMPNWTSGHQPFSQPSMPGAPHVCATGQREAQSQYQYPGQQAPVYPQHDHSPGYSCCGRYAPAERPYISQTPSCDHAKKFACPSSRHDKPSVSAIETTCAETQTTPKTSRSGSESSIIKRKASDISLQTVTVVGASEQHTNSHTSPKSVHSALVSEHSDFLSDSPQLSSKPKRNSVAKSKSVKSNTTDTPSPTTKVLKKVVGSRLFDTISEGGATPKRSSETTDEFDRSCDSTISVRNTTITTPGHLESGKPSAEAVATQQATEDYSLLVEDPSAVLDNILTSIENEEDDFLEDPVLQSLRKQRGELLLQLKSIDEKLLKISQTDI